MTDNLTGLVWLKNANCFGVKEWWEWALDSVKNLTSGACGLTDGSTAGQWRLPNIIEMESLIDPRQYGPALPAGHPFSSVPVTKSYWVSTSFAFSKGSAWIVDIGTGGLYTSQKYNNSNCYAWPVRDAQ